MKTWLDCIPFVEFAYNSSVHSATKLSPFEVVYGAKPLTPLDLTPLPQAERIDQAGFDRGEYVRKLHQTTRDNILKKTEEYKRRADKKRKEVIFEPGDLVWLHMRAERFPHKRTSKLSPRGDGPYRVLERINDNAYKLELPGEFTMSHTFNVTDLSPYEVGEEAVLRTKPVEEGGNDEDIDSSMQSKGDLPTIPIGPLTRSKAKKLAKEYNLAIEALLNPTTEVQEEIAETLRRLNQRLKEDDAEDAEEDAELREEDARNDELGKDQRQDHDQEESRIEKTSQEDRLEAQGTSEITHFPKLHKTDHNQVIFNLMSICAGPSASSSG